MSGNTELLNKSEKNNLLISFAKKKKKAFSFNVHMQKYQILHVIKRLKEGTN